MNNELTKQKEYWDKAVEDFDAIYSKEKNPAGIIMDRLVRWDMYKRFEYTMAHSEPIPGRSFLDVGCGTGRYSLEYALKGASLVVGLDVSEKMISTCIQRAHELGFSPVTRFIQTDLLDYLPEALFDVCIGIGLFDYIQDPLPVMKKMAASVTDRVIMSFPTIWTWKAPVRKIWLGSRGCGVYFYKKGDVENLVRAAGFAGYTIEKVGQLYCVTAFMARSVVSPHGPGHDTGKDSI